MLNYDYMEPTFDIMNIPCFNNVDGLKDISQYLDFAISSTIYKQKPNVTMEQEKKYAATILKGFMSGDLAAFTSQYNIRKNMQKIGPEKLKALLLKSLLETQAYNERVLHQLSAASFKDQCANYITESAYNGQLKENESWIMSNIPSFIDMYIEDRYREGIDKKEQLEAICYSNPKTLRAVEQLNLQMHINSIQY